jgi:hypothetical protein
VIPLEKEHSTCLDLLLQLATRVYLLVIVLLPETFYLGKVMVLGGGCVLMVG